MPSTEPEIEPETTVADEAPTQVSQVVESEILEEEIESETDEREIAEAEAAERDRRRRSVDSVDPPTEDQKLTELL